MEASPLSNLATDGRVPRRRGQRGKRVALWPAGYLYVLCCKLVRVRMHHGPMGRSMDYGNGWVDVWMDGWMNGRMG